PEVASALLEAGNRAGRDISTSAILIGGFATLYASTYAIPAVIAGLTALGETEAVGPGTGAEQKSRYKFPVEDLQSCIPRGYRW
ncbi:MAG: hypothetical protein KGM92_13855, partial [Acidobacteriota bacterium]|nr:hypothetical protein [Acidobacteriota bacterium]